MPEKKTKVKFGLKNLAMLSSYFDYIFVHLRQKARFRPELSPKFSSVLGPNPARTRPEKRGPTYDSASIYSPNVLYSKLYKLLLLQKTKHVYDEV